MIATSPVTVRCALLATLLLPFSGEIRAQSVVAPLVTTAIDPSIKRVLDETPAFDNHAHPLAAPPAMATDRGFDALPVDNMEPQTDPLAWRPDYQPLALAWKALWNFTATPPLSPPQLQQLEAARSEVRRQQAEAYPNFILAKAGIGTMLANRVSMGPGLNAPQFLWVPYDDALLFPFDNAILAAKTPDRTQFFALEDKLRAKYMEDAGLHALPSSLQDYLQQVVTPTLQRQKAGGAVAIKFEVAYLRDFDFADVSRQDADKAWAKLSTGGQPDAPGYRAVQNFLFRFIAGECGRLRLVVHLHGMAGGGRYFGIAGVNPLLLEPVLNDARLRNTNFVLLHGGWPYLREAGAMLQKTNFYLDLSQQALIFPAHTLAGWLREWLETYPEKVLFGTDAYPYTSSMGWEESAWLAAHNEREAIGLALTNMERDGEISPTRANELARMVLRGNAEALYGLKP